ncbi:hypothetical protein M413DRAFT_438062 [Hebeloma cylindrosporum]|uniref:Uncharacterized protein n=1 Tax=Hebeloma cylindrosporum TaxID=76867 RepID=A0A0C3CXK3_HEBCY|nr:hypothetical protein M413DRAFT_438062 [Hebeloma cylindrosporum h7]
MTFGWGKVCPPLEAQTCEEPMGTESADPDTLESKVYLGETGKEGFSEGMAEIEI